MSLERFWVQEVAGAPRGAGRKLGSLSTPGAILAPAARGPREGASPLSGLRGWAAGGFASPPPSRPSWGPRTLGEVGGCPNPSVAPILSTRLGCIPGQEPCNIPRLGALASQRAWVRVPCAPPRSPLRRERSAGSWRAPAAGGVWSPATLPPRGRLGQGKMAAAPGRGAPGPARAEPTY